MSQVAKSPPSDTDLNPHTDALEWGFNHSGPGAQVLSGSRFRIRQLQKLAQPRILLPQALQFGVQITHGLSLAAQGSPVVRSTQWSGRRFACATARIQNVSSITA